MTAATPGGPVPRLRLPGSVAEVDASPEGPGIGAFFDLDGTLVAGFTAAAHTLDRLRRREVGPGDFLRLTQLAVEYKLGRGEVEALIESGAGTARGRLAEDVEEMGERIFRHSVADQIYPEMRDLVRAHQRRGHTVVLSSSALTMQAEPVARYLGIDRVLCNRFVVDEHGVLTGAIEQPVIWGPTKATSVQKFAADHDIDLRSSYFYADGDEDVALMYLVGNPRPVNPGPTLTRVAERRGWPILRLHSRGSGGPLGRIRNLAALGSLGPVAAGALGITVVTRSKRAGINFLTRFWPEIVLQLSGVTLNVIGAENLTAQRPAVFLFNHRNNFDVFMVAALVKDNWTGVAKKELASNPLVGTLGRLLDAAFVDRHDTADAVAALKPVEEAARNGLSILVAPEGTRRDTAGVGPFKKGAFRIAMATGLPVVPIVIRNSDSVAGRNATTLHPGTVDIAVLPPVSVADWTVANLGDKIEQIRGDYQELLADWPATLDGRYEAAARVSRARHAGAAAMPGPRNEERARGPAAAPGGPAKPAAPGGPAKPAAAGGQARSAATGGPAKPAGSGGPAKPAGSGGPAKPAGSGGPAKPAAAGGQARSAATGGQANTAPPSGAPEANGKTP